MTAASATHFAALALASAVAAASVACAGSAHRGGQAAPASAGPSPQAPPANAQSSAEAKPQAMSASVGGGFWSPRLRAVTRALGACEPAAASPVAPLSERAAFDALAWISLDGSAVMPDVPATCRTSCARPEWSGQDSRVCAALAALAALDRAVWRVDPGQVPAVMVALIADSELSFASGDVQWRIEQGTDYPWSSHVGFTLSHRGPGDSQGGAERALELKLALPEWIDPASVRVSARGRMLGAGDFASDGRTLTISGPWADGDRAHVSFQMPPRRMTAPGGVEIWRGPLRYVAEAADQPGAALADTTIAPGDSLRDVPYVLGALSPADAGARQGDPVTQRPTPEPDAAANSAPNGIMAVMVDRRARGLPDLVLVPLAFAGNRGDMQRVGTFAAPAK